METGEFWIAHWMMDSESGWTYVDRAWSARAGQSPQEALGFGWLAAFHPDARAGVESEARSAWAARAPFALRRRLRRAEGGYGPARVTASPRFSADGGFLGLVGSVCEVPAETAPGEEGFYGPLLDALADGAFIAQDYEFVFANPALPAMLGRAPNDLAGLPFEAVIAPEDLAMWTARFEAGVGDGPEPTRHYPVRLLKKTGERVEAELAARRIRYRGRNAVLGVLRDVTERRRAEAALGESEACFRQVVQSLPQLVWTCAPDGPCDYLSPQWLAYTGVPQETQLGYGWLEQLHPDDRAPTAERWRVAAARGEEFVTDFRIRRADGAYRWFHTLAAPLKDDAGRILKWFGTNTDVTEMKDAEEALRESEARFQSFMRHLPGLAWMKDAGGRYVYVNDAVEAALGKPRDLLYGCADAELFDPDTATAFEKNDAAAKASATGVLATETLKDSNGLPHHWLVSKFQMRDAAGAPKGVGGVAIDITAQLRIQDALEQQSRLIDLSFEPIFIWDWDKGIVTWNRGCEQLYGYARAEARGRSSQGLLQTRFPASREAFEAELLERGEWAGELEHTAKDGRDICVESRQQLIRADGRRLVLEANRDVSERKRVELALREAGKRKDEFLATLAHELRNPLAPISYGVQLLKAEAAGRKEPRHAAMLAMMERQVLHLVKLVDDLLEISRIDQGKIELRREPADLASIVRIAVESSQPQIEKGRHRLEKRFPEEPLIVDGDPMRLSQAVMNLVNNAAKFTPEGGLIEIEAQRRGGDAVLRVRDNGRGISAESLPHVFDLFAQIEHGERDSHGLGIGLALVRKLVTLHGGSIEAFSAGPGQGSEFVVTLPLDRQSVGTRHAAEDAEAPSRYALRAVVIDDDRDAADSLRMALEELGAKARVAYDGLRGAQIVEALAPDVVFLDLGMPGMDGFETARRIRSRPAGRKLTLVALTGWGRAGDRARTAAEGFDAHLTKPASLDALESVLRAARRKPREARAASADEALPP